MEEKEFDYINVIPLVDVMLVLLSDCPDDIDIYRDRDDFGFTAEVVSRSGRNHQEVCNHDRPKRRNLFQFGGNQYGGTGKKDRRTG